MKYFLVLLVGWFWMALAAAQSGSGYIQVWVSDSLGRPLEGATVGLDGKPIGLTDPKGYFLGKTTAGKRNLLVTGLNVKPYQSLLTVPSGDTLTLRLRLRVNLQPEVTIVAVSDTGRTVGMVIIRPELVRSIVTPGDALTQLIRQVGIGVSTNNELSSGYSVRGGNFDENLTYVNGVEIYRPFLARSGQQEGLSFVNPDMVDHLGFSGGGFEARYGDKMASVLDVVYKKPTRFEASGSISFLGGSAYLGDAWFNNRLKVSTGFRYKSNNYILSGMDTRGDYQPNFADLQTYWVYEPSEKWEISFLGNYSDNNYRIIPNNRTTQFGHVQQAKQLRVFFDGQEQTRFQVLTGILATEFRANGFQSKIRHRLSLSAYQTRETEHYDIIGQYLLGEIEADPSQDNFGEVVNTVGVGTFQNHARNRMFGRVLSADYQARFQGKKKFLFSHQATWGLNYRNEYINDRLSEWNLLDSSGYHLSHGGPFDTGPMILDEVRKSTAELHSNRIQGFYQHTFLWNPDTHHVSLTVGMRAHYWDLNGDVFVSPRAQLAIRPHWKRDVMFRMAGGIYYQAPFYRELRDLEGQLNTQVRAQRSWHLLGGFDWNFKWGNRPFKLITEAYYKGYDDLNPYKIDNVRIRYYANNQAVGYAAGLDVKLHGEFIRGLDSWLSLSVMQTEEDILGDQMTLPDGSLVEAGYIPRPTDQRVVAGIFFQDHIPNLERCRVHLNLQFGAQLPYGPPSGDRFADTLRAPFYRRVDIGFSYVFIQNPTLRENRVKHKWARSVWASLDFFNLLDINNTISYLWVRDITNRRYAVPNYLTPRLINLRLVFDF